MSNKKGVQLLDPTHDKYKFIKIQNQLLKAESEIEYFEIDKKRLIGPEEKNQVWKIAKSHELFDNNLFRIDMVGNTCILLNFLKKLKIMLINYFITIMNI